VLIKIMRVNCSEEETETETVICPIFGSIWYDDFSLKRRR
jgi:hypothetical protein